MSELTENLHENDLVSGWWGSVGGVLEQFVCRTVDIEL